MIHTNAWLAQHLEINSHRAFSGVVGVKEEVFHEVLAELRNPIRNDGESKRTVTHINITNHFPNAVGLDREELSARIARAVYDEVNLFPGPGFSTSASGDVA